MILGNIGKASFRGGRGRLNQHGATLVELMAGLVIATVTITAGFMALTGSEKAAHINDQTVQIQQNARVAMELVSRDLKVAGFGVIGPVGFCNTAIVPADNNPAGADTGADSVSMVVPTTSNVAPLWTLAAQAVGAFNTITLQTGAVAEMTTAGLAVNGMISIGGTVSTSVTGIAGDTLTLGSTIGAPAVFPAGTPVFLLQCITYQVIRPGDPNVAACGGNAPCLVRGVAPNAAAPRDCNTLPNTCVAIAEGIEDLQVAYACDGCNALANGGVADRIIDDQGAVNNTFEASDFISNNNWTTAPLTPDTIRLVRVNIVARQTRNDQGFGEGRTPAVSTTAPLVVEDHNPSADIGYNATTYAQLRRRLLTRTVQNRNLGL